MQEKPVSHNGAGGEEAFLDGTRLLDALADANRRKIFNALLEEPMPVKIIAADMPISQPAVSQHLRIMREAGLVREDRRGRYHYYGVNPAALNWLSRQFGALRDDVLNATDESPSVDGSQAEALDPVDSAMAEWAQVWPEHDALSAGIIVRLFLIVRHLETLSGWAASPYGISYPELQLLGTLDRIAPRESTLAELAKISLVSLPSAAKHLNRIEQLGLMKRRPVDDSKGTNLIRITGKGRDVLHEIMAHEMQDEHAAIYQMPEADRIQLVRLLKPLLQELQDRTRQPDLDR